MCTQRINPDGIYQWRVDGVTVNNFSDSRYPQITTDGGTGAIVTWDTGDGNIYAHRIDSAGTVLWDVHGIGISLDPLSQYEPKIAEDGNGGAIIVWDDYRNNTTSSTLVNRKMEPGSYTVIFDATGLPGGVLYYCMKTDKEMDVRSMILVK